MKLEELRADIADVKEMYREQVNLLVNKVQSYSFPKMLLIISINRTKLKQLIIFADSNFGFVCWRCLIFPVLWHKGASQTSTESTVIL